MKKYLIVLVFLVSVSFMSSVEDNVMYYTYPVAYESKIEGTGKSIYLLSGILVTFIDSSGKYEVGDVCTVSQVTWNRRNFKK